MKITIKNGCQLNPKQKIVDKIIAMCDKNDGICPCHNESVDPKCPCSDYRIKDICHCGLYEKIN